jgi:uncharacterized damage-inducible protein DinB
MVTQASNRLAEQLREQAHGIERAVAGLSESDARRPPGAGAWSVVEVLSHLCGADATAFLSTITRFIDEEQPTIDVVPGISHFESRSGASLDELSAEFRTQYETIASYLGGLSDAQLQRTAHIELLKQTPFGAYPTLEQWVTTISDFHLKGHIAQIAEIRRTIGA